MTSDARRWLLAAIAALAPALARAQVAGENASFVLGQPNMTSNAFNYGGVSAFSLGGPGYFFSDGTRLFVADTANNRVLIWNSVPSSTNTPANVVVGQPNMTSNTPNTGGISSATLSSPEGVFSDGANLYVADSGNNRVLIYYGIPAANGAAANVVVGQPGMTTSTANAFGLTAASLQAPFGVHSDGTRLYIADSGNNRVLLFNAIPTSAGASANLAVGQPNLVSNSTPTPSNAASLWQPKAVRWDGTRLYVADSHDGRVLIYNGLPAASGVSANVAMGVPDFATNGGSTTLSASSMWAPSDVYTDGTRLFVADPGAQRVLIYNQVPATTGAAADEVVGQANFTANTATTSQTGLFGPSGVVVASGTLFVADSQNNRLAAFPMPTAANCGSGYVPYFVPQQYPSIQAGVNAVAASPPPAGKNACVAVSSGTYLEQVTVQGISLSGSSSTISILSSSATVTISPPPASQAAFVIANASVTLTNLAIAPTSSISYGVLSSSANTTIANVSVNDTSGRITIAGLALSSAAVVSNSTVTVNHAGTNALLLMGSWSAVISCSFTSISDSSLFPYFPGNATVWIDGASNSTITNSFLNNQSGGGALALGGYAPAVAATNNDTISYSTITSHPNNVNCNAAYADLGTHGAAFVNDYIQSIGTCGQALQLGSQSSGADTVTNSTMVATSQALVLQASSSSVSYSFMSANVSYAAAFSQGGNDSISFSTMTGGAAGLLVAGAGDSAINDFIQGSTAVVIGSLAASTVLSSDNFVATAGGQPAVWMLGSNGLTLSNSILLGTPNGPGLFLDNNNSGSIALSNLSVQGAAVGVRIGNQTGASVSVSSMNFASLPLGATAFWLTGGTQISTFTGVAFADPHIAVNVNTTNLSPGSAITMLQYTGPRAGPGFAVDTGTFVAWNEPVSTITVPAPSSVVNSFASIQGTAAAFNTTVSAVTAVARNLATGLYWNGGAFASPTAVNVATAFSGFSSGTWTLALGSAALTNGTAYQVTSQAFDALGDFQAVLAVASFTFDNPASAILAPTAGAALSSLPAIQGTAATLGSAQISAVTVSVRDLATGFYWNGASFAPGNVFNPAAVFPSSWTYSNSIGSAWVSGRSYQIMAQATDSLGATQLGFSSTTFLFDNTLPSVAMTFPVQGGVYASIANLAGTSADNVLVTTVSVQIQQMSPAACYDLATNAFDLACTPAAFIPAQGSTASWTYSAPIPWVSGAQYLVTARSLDEAGNQSATANAFTFQTSTTLAAGNPGDGGGAAAVAPTASAGCQLITATATYTAGLLGISSGGVVALHVPAGWTPPQGSSPGLPGFTQILSTTAFGAQFNPAQVSSAALGSNWIVYFATSAVSPGQAVQFVYTGFPPTGPAAQAPQPFFFASQGGPSGRLIALSSAPAMALGPGPAAGLAFSPTSTLALGPLQASPTMQVQVVDACGAPTSAPANVAVGLQAQVAGAPDGQAQFYNVAGGTTSSVLVTTGALASPPFSFNSSTTGVSLESLLAQASFSGSPATALRAVRWLAAPPSLSGVSVDTGTPGAALSAAVTPASASSGRAFINFTLSDPSLSWEVIVSSVPGFASKAADFFGTGNPGRTLAWNGANLLATPPQYLGPGVYYVEINVAQGAAVNAALTINIAPSASIYGAIANGPGALVSAVGPGTGPGASVIASTSGFFQIFGLQNGSQYNVTATSAAASLSVSSIGVTATVAGSSVGSLSFPAQGILQVAATLPFAAPVELFGGLLVHTTDYAQTASGLLHIPQGTLASDNGMQQFGVAASSWTQILLPPGTYQVDASLPRIGLSTSVFGVTVAAGQTIQLPLALTRLANVYGYVSLPTAASTAVPVAVQAQQMGAARPSVFGGAVVPIGASSAVYSLFGLAPGNWTLTTAAPGYVSASSAVFIAGSSDVGTPASGGFNLSLSSRPSQVAGLLTVIGNTAALGAFTVPVYVDNGASPAASVSLASGASQTSSTFTLTGLPDGIHSISAALAGYYSGARSFAVTEGQGSASLALAPTQSNLALTFKLPGGPHPAADFAGVSFGLLSQTFGQRGPSGAAYPPIPAANWTQYGPSSATVDLGGITADVTQILAFYSGNGAYQQTSVVVAPGTTSYVTLDLSSPSYAVSGTLLLSQNVNVPQNGFSVNVSSIAGLLANTGTTSYCLLGSTTPQAASFAHLELLPQNGGSFLGGPLPTADAAGCSSQLPGMLTAPLNGPHPYWAYLSTMDVNGRFSFPAVPPGVYLLRNNPVMDASGDQLPKFAQVVTVTAPVSGLLLPIGSGNAISGSVLAPAGTTLNRQAFVSLMDSQGRLVSQTPASFNNTAAATYLISQVPPGAYSLLVRDSIYPKQYAAAPTAVQVAGQDLAGQNIQLVQGGIIKLRLAVQQTLPGGSTQFVLINPFNGNLLPAGLAIEALSDPWFNGGIGLAGGPSGSTVPVLDANGQFLLDGLLGGTYDLKLLTPTGAAANASVSGIAVAAAGTTDLGVVNLAAAAQLSGQTLDAGSGSPLPNVIVQARPSLRGAGALGQPVSAVTDASGRFSLAGLDPSVRLYDVFAAARGDFERQGESLAPYQQTAALSIDVSSVTRLNFSLPPAPYSISGQVATPGGQLLQLPFSIGPNSNQGPQLGAGVLLQKAGVAPVRNPIADIIFATDLGGNFTIPSLSSGIYTLTVDALGYAYASQIVTITTASVNLGTIQLSTGASLSGALTSPGGSSPSPGQAAGIIAIGSSGATIIGSLTTDPNSQAVTGYQISGFKVGPTYQVLILDSVGNFTAPAEASSLVFASTAPQVLNLVYRPVTPLAAAKATRQGSLFQIEFDISQPLRGKTAADNNLATILSTASAAGALGQFALSSDRTKLTAVYAPGAGESSFTLSLNGYSAVVNPNSLDPVNPQYQVQALTTFYVGIDGLGQANIPNFQGGNVLVAGNAGRVTLPPDAFNVAASSSVQVTLQLAGMPVTGPGASAVLPGARLSALRYGPQAYPSELVAAAAAVPPGVNPLSPFYNIFLPIGINHALSAPSQITLSYSSGTDPSTLNAYWFNSAANTYVLQPDVTGASPAIDPVARTLTINVNHFSTFVLFASNQSAIAGSSGANDFQAYNFPNPFDLTQKTVTTIHSAAGNSCNPSCSIRGTMVALLVPPGLSGEGELEIFDVAGARLKTIDLGSLSGGNFYYQSWDGTNDAGRDVASGVYIGELKVGGQSTFFKMAVIKGSNK